MFTDLTAFQVADELMLFVRLNRFRVLDRFFSSGRLARIVRLLNHSAKIVFHYKPFSSLGSNFMMFSSVAFHTIAS